MPLAADSAGMVLDDGDRDALAAALGAARRDADPIDPPRARYDLTMADGYAVQRRWVPETVSGERVGYKLGFTNAAVREEVGVGHPVYGRLHAGNLLDDRGGGPAADADRYVAPRVEPEIVLRLGTPVGAPATVEDCRTAVDGAIPAIELVDSRIRGWDVTPPEAVADNGLAAGLALGDPTALAAPLADEAVTVAVGGDPVAEGSGAAAMDGPLRALAWLVEARGDRAPLPAGTLVSTGSLTGTLQVEAGDDVTARFERLGDVTLRLR